MKGAGPPPRNKTRIALAAASFSVCPVLAQAPPVNPPHAQILPEPAQTMLARDLGFTLGQLVLARNGQVVVKVLEAPHPREVAVAGVTRIAISKEAFFARYRDIEAFKRHEAVQQLGRFSRPPQPADLASLTFNPDMLDDLRSCRPGRCKVKLPADWMTTLRDTVDWSAPTHRDDAQRIFKGLLVGYIDGYHTRGASALVEYRDKEPPLRLADAFAALVEHSPYLATVSPAFAGYLIAYPDVNLPVQDSFVYWSQEQFGLKPVVSITHVAVCQALQHPNVMIGASKQLYATHYFEASLGLTFAIDDGAEGRPGIYLIYVNRTRADALKGVFVGVRRSLVQGRAREGVENTLKALKRTLEGTGG